MAVSKQVSEQVSEQGEDATTDDDVSSLSYEQARDELISIVAALEGGQLGLEESMRLWRRGEALAAHCSTWLDGAEAALTEGDET
ncbi:exodeoxyribonuclease VII small subunit [Pedococcus sp.]|uniref:exodeoxyribonuclease VII small subunit n=1 Tax=Pedococcus sp. TaxID=2860345 RepID=UPI002E157B36|nr:exodeoxyribonuclease VII small subunit [Pedococcus sp.]